MRATSGPASAARRQALPTSTLDACAAGRASRGFSGILQVHGVRRLCGKSLTHHVVLAFLFEPCATDFLRNFKLRRRRRSPPALVRIRASHRDADSWPFRHDRCQARAVADQVRRFIGLRLGGSSAFHRLGQINDRRGNPLRTLALGLFDDASSTTPCIEIDSNVVDADIRLSRSAKTIASPAPTVAASIGQSSPRSSKLAK